MNAPTDQSDDDGFDMDAIEDALVDGFLPLPMNGTKSVQYVSRKESARRIFSVIGKKKNLFYRSGSLCRIVGGKLKDLRPETFTTLLEDYGIPAKMVISDGKVMPLPIICTVAQAKELMASDEARELLPNVRMVAQSPVLYGSENGELHYTEPGWNDVFGGIYQLGDIKIELCGAIVGARVVLRELTQDFEFQTPEDEARFMAALLTPALSMGGLIKSSVPMLVMEADESQSGKGYAQKLIAALYGEKLHVITQKSRGGVGSLDESFGQALVSGNPFIQFDNVRGSLNSMMLEAVMTADGIVSCRILRESVDLDPSGRFLMLTSNGFTTTPDLANRSLVVRITKRSGGEFKEYPEGDLLDYVRANQGKYLGAIFTIIGQWHSAKKPGTQETRHDFRPWCRPVDWIVQSLGLPPMMGGHRELQDRQSTEGLSLLRAIALAVEAKNLLGAPLTTGELASYASDHGVEVGGGEKPATWVGRILGPIFSKSATVDVDRFRVLRVVEQSQRTDGRGAEDSKIYIFNLKDRKIQGLTE